MSRRDIQTAAAILLGLCATGLSYHPASADEAYELGAYLSGECQACHLKSEDAEGIPPITGWPADSFVMVLEAYKDGSRENDVMQRVARTLSGDDIKALAIFYEQQD